MICNECGAVTKSLVRMAFEKAVGESGIELFTDMLGNDVFTLHGMSGGIYSHQVFYLILRKGEHAGVCLPVWLIPEWNVDEIMAHAIANFHFKNHEVDLQGGDLGLPGA